VEDVDVSQSSRPEVAADSSQQTRLEIATVVLLGLVALVTAWAAFQASLWSGVSLDFYAQADTRQQEASFLRETSTALSQEDQAVFIEYLKSARAGDARLAGIIKTEIMAKRLRDAVDAWERAPPATRGVTPLSDVYGYIVPGKPESVRRLEESRSSLGLAREANTYGDTYNLAAVLFAGALFLVGISSTLRLPRFRAALLVVGAVIFLTTAGWMATVAIQNPF